MPDILVSIIINNYNYGRYLGDAIDSALGQDYPAVEVVVVDDGSTDDSRDVMHTYGDRIIRVCQPNQGQGAAFNSGFARSRGQVVIFLDSDDILFADAARRFVPHFDDPTVVHCLGQLALCDGQKRPLGRNFSARPVQRGNLRDQVLRYGPWAYRTIPTTGNAFARHYLTRVMPMPAPDFIIGGDDYLSIISPLYGLLSAIDEPTGWYRLHGRNVYWRKRLGLEDLAVDVKYFERDVAVIAEHARRLGLLVDIARWKRSDWRQQVRERLLWLGRNSGIGPRAADLVTAALLDQTHPVKKAFLLPMLLLFLAAPRNYAMSIGLRLLGRTG